MTSVNGEWSIQHVARLAGTTSRTLRHYDELGLLPPSRVGEQGYRYYDQAALLRLQRILLLRDLGLGLSTIGDLLAGSAPARATLRTHLELLELERERLERRIESVRTTLGKTERGEALMAEEMFDGFDHAQHREEVVERWGEEAYRRSDAWYRSLSDRDRRGFAEAQAQIAADFAEARKAGRPADGPQAVAIARRQFDWVARAWRSEPSAEAFVGLGEMYVADPRFTPTYDAHGIGTAAYVRDAMKAFAERELG